MTEVITPSSVGRSLTAEDVREGDAVWHSTPGNPVAAILPLDLTSVHDYLYGWTRSGGIITRIERPVPCRPELPTEPQETAWREWNRQPDGTYEEDQIRDEIGHTDFIGGWDAAAAHYATRLGEVEQERDAMAAQSAEAREIYTRGVESAAFAMFQILYTSPQSAVARLRAETLEAEVLDAPDSDVISVGYLRERIAEYRKEAGE